MHSHLVIKGKQKIVVEICCSGHSVWWETDCDGCETFQIIVLLFHCNKQCNLFKSRNLLANLLLPFLVPYVETNTFAMFLPLRLFSWWKISNPTVVSVYMLRLASVITERWLLHWLYQGDNKFLSALHFKDTNMSQGQLCNAGGEAHWRRQ